MRSESLKDRCYAPWAPILHELQFNQRRNVDIGWCGDTDGGPSRVYRWVLWEYIGDQIKILGQGNPGAEGNEPEIRELASRHAD